jgi:hypothetical protein
MELLVYNICMYLDNTTFEYPLTASRAGSRLERRFEMAMDGLLDEVEMDVGHNAST